jgi:hypothetical protein
MIALDFYGAVFYRSSGSASALQFAGQAPYSLFVQRHPENDGYRLPSPATGFPADPHDPVTRAGSAFSAAGARRCRLSATRADAAQFRRIDENGIPPIVLFHRNPLYLRLNLPVNKAA